MDTSSWTIDSSMGELLVRTEAAGPAARLGHDLTLVMDDWKARLAWADGHPSSVEVVIRTKSLRVLRSDGGVKSLSGVEKALVRSNARKALDAERHDTIEYRSEDVTADHGGYRLAGSLVIHGTARPWELSVQVADLGATWRITCESVVRQTEFGVKPYSLMMGSLRVADTVTVCFAATHDH